MARLAVLPGPPSYRAGRTDEIAPYQTFSQATSYCETEAEFLEF